MRGIERLSRVGIVCLGLVATSGLAACQKGPRQVEFQPERDVVIAGGALNGVTANWPARGPSPTQFGQVENFGQLDAGIPAGGTPNEVSGAIRIVVPHPTLPNTLYIGTANGGVWRTDNARAASPTWTALTDQQDSLSIGGLAINPTEPADLVAGFGRFSSFGTDQSPFGGAMGGVILTTDGGTTWNPVNPPGLSGQRISAVAVRGTAAGSQLTLMAAAKSFGGLYRSTNSGGMWTQISGAGTLPAGSIDELVGDPSNAARFYVSVLGVGIFRSDDTGATWNPVSAGDTSGLATAVTGAAAAKVRLAVGNDGRVFVMVNTRRFGSDFDCHLAYVGTSANQGGTWSAMELPFTNIPASSGTITAATNASPIVITTSGNHNLQAFNRQFIRITGVVGNTAANGDFQITPSSTPVLNQITLRGSTGNGAYVSGGTWFAYDDMYPGGQGILHSSLAVDPTNSSIVYIGGDRQAPPGLLNAGDFTGRLFRGTFSGMAPTVPNPIPSGQWANLTHGAVTSIPFGGTTRASAPHADSRQMVFDAGGDLIEVDDGGIARRTNPRGSNGDWFSVNGNLQVTEIHDIAFDPISNVIVGGTQDTGEPNQNATNSAVWEEDGELGALLGDGGDIQIDASGNSGANNSLRYLAGANFQNARRVAYSSAGVEGTLTFLGLTSGTPGVNPSFPFRTIMKLNKVTTGTNWKRLVILTNDGVWESSDQGDNITRISTLFAPSAAVYGHAASGNAETLWVASGSTVAIRTTAGGAVTNTTTAYPGPGIADLALDTNDATSGYVVSSTTCPVGGLQGCVFHTPDSGTATWDDITGDLRQLNPGLLRSVVFVPGAPSKIFVGADRGVFVTSTASLGFWNRVGAALPRAIVMDMDYVPAPSDTLYLGTMGRGAWSLATASLIDLPPAAKCRNVTVDAGPSCTATVTPADVNNGSFDPDGQPVTLGSLSPPGPYGITTTNVTLSMSSSGGSESCTAQITVRDTVPPTVTAPANVQVSRCAAGDVFVGIATGSDTCSAVTFQGKVISKNGAPLNPQLNVVNGHVTLGQGTYVVEWKSFDGTNFSPPANQTVVVNDPNFRNIQQLANGDMRYFITFPGPPQQYVEAFVRQNGVQNVAGNIVGSRVNNPDGTFTYSRVVPASQYHAGDVISVRFYSYRPSSPGVFTPGPVEGLWFPDFIYGAGTDCIDGCHPTFQKKTNGNIVVSLNRTAPQVYAEAFVRRNGTQIAAGNVVNTGVNNGDGTFTYSRMVPASQFQAANIITWRWAAQFDGQPIVFFPGPTSSTFFPPVTYGTAPANDCAP